MSSEPLPFVSVIIPTYNRKESLLRNHLRLISRHWSGVRRSYLWSKVVLRNMVTIAAFTVKSQGGKRIPNRDACLLALRDAMLGRWGKMGPDVQQRVMTRKKV